MNAHAHDHDHTPGGSCCGHDHAHLHFDLNADDNLLDRSERRRLAVRLSLAVLCAGLLVIALVLHVLWPAQRDPFRKSMTAGVLAMIFRSSISDCDSMYSRSASTLRRTSSMELSYCSEIWARPVIPGRTRCR